MDDSMIKEGLVFVHRKGEDNRPLFYNHSQVFNRDLSLIVLKTFIMQQKRKAESNPKLGKFMGVNILETLAATGIRGIRYLKELGDLVNTVTFNDLDRNSAEMIVKNAQLNEIERNKFRVTCCDANLLSSIFTPPPDVEKFFQMAGNIFKIPAGTLNAFSDILIEFNKVVDSFLKIVSVSDLEHEEARSDKVSTSGIDDINVGAYRNIVDVIDLDPYSSATSFIDSAVRSVRSGGILLITSTDMPTLCGNNPLVSFYKYGGTSFKSPFCHELSLRTLLYSIMLTASRYKRIIKPLLSCSVDFYVRVIVQVRYFPEECKKVASNAGLVLLCVQCHSYRIAKLCEDFVMDTSADEASNQKDANIRSQQHSINGVRFTDGNNNKIDSSNNNNVGINGDVNDKQVYGSENIVNRHKKRKHKRPVSTSNFAKVCEECGGRMKVGGPIYIGPLHDKPFVQDCIDFNAQIFKESKKKRNKYDKNEVDKDEEEMKDSEESRETDESKEPKGYDGSQKSDGCEEEGSSYTLTGVTMAKRVRGLLISVMEELDVPMFYSVSDLCQIWNLSTISPVVFRKLLENMGYQASIFHRDPNSIKTNAPNHVVMDIIRTHAKNLHKVPNHEFFKRQIDTIGIDLDLKINRVKQLPRWIPNPTSHWGPKKKHRTCSSSIKP